MTGVALALHRGHTRIRMHDPSRVFATGVFKLLQPFIVEILLLAGWIRACQKFLEFHRVTFSLGPQCQGVIFSVTAYSRH